MSPRAFYLTHFNRFCTTPRIVSEDTPSFCMAFMNDETSFLAEAVFFVYFRLITLAACFLVRLARCLISGKRATVCDETLALCKLQRPSTRKRSATTGQEKPD